MGPFDLLPGTHHRQYTICGSCSKNCGLSILPGLVGFPLGLVAAVYAGQAGLHQAETIFGAQLGVMTFLLVLAASFAVWAVVTILVAKALYRFYRVTRSG